MSRHYLNAKDASDPYTLPSLEIFRHDGSADMVDDEGEALPAGFYYWFCFPGCMPDSDPSGPFETEDEALQEARDLHADDYQEVD